MWLTLLSVVFSLSLICASVDAAPVDNNTPQATPYPPWTAAATPTAALNTQIPPPLPNGDPAPPKFPSKAPICPGMGVMLKNARKTKESYYFYNNIWNGDGKAGPNMVMDKPDKTVDLAAGEEKYVPLDNKFKGRIRKYSLEITAISLVTYFPFSIQALASTKTSQNIPCY